MPKFSILHKSSTSAVDYAIPKGSPNMDVYILDLKIQTI